MKCVKCFWHDSYKVCPTCDHQIHEERNYMKDGFLRCHDRGAITHKYAKTLETTFYSRSEEGSEKEDFFFHCCNVVKIRIKNFHVGLIFV